MELQVQVQLVQLHQVLLVLGTFIVNGGTISSDGATGRTFYNPVTFTGNGTFGHSTNTGTLTFEAAAELGALQEH